MTASPKIGDGIATIAMGDTLVTLWRLPATPERVRWLNDRLTELASSQSGDILHLMLILSTSTPPGAEGRSLFQKQVTDLDKSKKLRQFIVVALGDSFWLNIVRTIGRPIFFLIGKSHLLTLVESVEKGLVSVRKHPGPNTPSSVDLARAALQLADTLGVNAALVPGFTTSSAATLRA